MCYSTTKPNGGRAIASREVEDLRCHLSNFLIWSIRILWLREVKAPAQIYISFNGSADSNYTPRPVLHNHHHPRLVWINILTLTVHLQILKEKLMFQMNQNPRSCSLLSLKLKGYFAKETLIVIPGKHRFHAKTIIFLTLTNNVHSFAQVHVHRKGWSLGLQFI